MGQISLASRENVSDGKAAPVEAGEVACGIISRLPLVQIAVAIITAEIGDYGRPTSPPCAPSGGISCIDATVAISERATVGGTIR